MKLPIRKEYFDKIKSGEKKFEYRDAHITFQCEETGEELRKEIAHASIIEKELVPEDSRKVLGDKNILRMRFL